MLNITVNAYKNLIHFMKENDIRIPNEKILLSNRGLQLHTLLENRESIARFLQRRRNKAAEKTLR